MQCIHDDFVIITLNIINYKVHCILIDNRSSANMLFYDAIVRIGLFRDPLKWLDPPLASFSENVILVGAISLPLTTS